MSKFENLNHYETVILMNAVYAGMKQLGHLQSDEIAIKNQLHVLKEFYNELEALEIKNRPEEERGQTENAFRQTDEV